MLVLLMSPAGPTPIDNKFTADALIPALAVNSLEKVAVAPLIDPVKVAPAALIPTEND